MSNIKSSLVVFPNLDEKEINKRINENGIDNILSLIMHNQGVINEKLNKLLGSDNPLEQK